MKDSTNTSRSEVIHDTIVLQLKLIVDGFRDLLLMPFALIACLGGLIMHQKNPGRYLYRLLSYGRASDKWIGLFDDAEKDQLDPVELRNKSFNDLLKNTQATLESKYIDSEKKQKLLHKFNTALDEINNKINPEKNA